MTAADRAVPEIRVRQGPLFVDEIPDDGRPKKKRESHEQTAHSADQRDQVHALVFLVQAPVNLPKGIDELSRADPQEDQKKYQVRLVCRLPESDRNENQKGKNYADEACRAEAAEGVLVRRIGDMNRTEAEHEEHDNRRRRRQAPVELTEEVRRAKTGDHHQGRESSRIEDSGAEYGVEQVDSQRSSLTRIDVCGPFFATGGVSGFLQWTRLLDLPALEENLDDKAKSKCCNTSACSVERSGGVFKDKKP